ncbi:glycosyltransferase family 2 protein [Clostridium tyrobutyricum]|uniref:glycosyltransferase family 2 protein n=1 Tax=Clostridium tyrobutyricum TaxID=1519 RepID=UPI001C387944|nr:glycosyltransferase family 2 protein [Clostridium tyrobutyricum]MBV4425515.1 glycosyltransferase family 2 protein [Clostridium tyrobutyricum]
MIETVLIVLNYNDSETTKQFIKSIMRYDNINKIVIVDNCSTDDSFNELKQIEDEKIHIIKSNRNGGYAYGNNFGIKYAERQFNPKYLIISNPDVYFKKATLNACLHYINNHDKVGICTGFMKDAHGQLCISTGWKLPRYTDDLVLSTILLKRILKYNRLLYSKEYMNKRYINVDVITGSFFLIRDTTMKNIGYFDERTFLYCEERILAFKLIKNGYHNIILKDEFFIHNHSQTIDKNIKSSIKKLKILNKSKLIYYTYYYKINFFKKAILKLFFNIGVFERFIYKTIKQIDKK